MAYYQGDYYQGDFYQGDPFIGGLLAKGISFLAKKIFKRKITTVGTTELARRMTPGIRAGAFGSGAAVGAALGPGTIPIPFSPFTVTPSAFLPGGVPLISRRTGGPMIQGLAGPGPRGALAAAGGCCPSGYHLAKDGSGRCVRNRSMNVANPRALRRSLRRVAGFGKLAQRSKRDIRRAAKAIGA